MDGYGWMNERTFHFPDLPFSTGADAAVADKAKGTVMCMVYVIVVNRVGERARVLLLMQFDQLLASNNNMSH